MYLRLLKFLNRETQGRKVLIVGLSLTAGLCRGLLLATFNAAAARGGGPGTKGSILAAFAGTLAVYLAASYVGQRHAARMLSAMVQRLRLRLSGRLLFADLRFLEDRRPGPVYTQISHDIGQLAGAAGTLLSVVQSSVVVLFALAYLSWLSPIGLVVALVAVIFGAGLYYWQDRKSTALVQQARKKETIFYNALGDVLDGFKELKLRRARHADLMAHLTEVTGEIREFNLEVERLSLVNTLTSQTVTFGLIGILVFVIPSMFAGGASAILQFLAAVLYTVGPIESVISALPSISRARTALDNIESLDEALGRDLEDDHRPDVPAREFDALALRGVHFHFASKDKEEEFDVGPIDLEVRRGEILFIIGGNGAGKTTLLKLLTGLYRPLSGSVWLNGQVLPTQHIQAYREMFAAVFSDFHLFRRLYGIKNPDTATLDELLHSLNIKHKTRLDNGVFTTTRLSSGQRKRLCYAVDRLSDRQIYVFDEFASDQDPAFRRYFYRELLPDLKRQGKTVIAVTHDERWFDVADRVIKMEYGQMTEIGRGSDLAALVRTEGALPTP